MDLTRFGKFWDAYVESRLKAADDGSGWPGDEWGTPERWSAARARMFDPWGVQNWQRCVEIGAGSGKYTLPVLSAAAPDCEILCVDVSAKFLSVLGQRLTREAPQYLARTHFLLLKGQSAAETFKQIEALGWERQVDAFFSMDAMVHVDLQYLMAYLLTAALTLKPNGRLIMTLANALTQGGFRKLLSEVKQRYEHQDRATAKFEWCSPELIRGVVERLGFTIKSLSSPQRDMELIAELTDLNAAERCREHLL